MDISGALLLESKGRLSIVDTTESGLLRRGRIATDVRRQNYEVTGISPALPEIFVSLASSAVAIGEDDNWQRTGAVIWVIDLDGNVPVSSPIVQSDFRSERGGWRDHRLGSGCGWREGLGLFVGKLLCVGSGHIRGRGRRRRSRWGDSRG